MRQILPFVPWQKQNTVTPSDGSEYSFKEKPAAKSSTGVLMNGRPLNFTADPVVKRPKKSPGTRKPVKGA